MTTRHIQNMMFSLFIRNNIIHHIHQSPTVFHHAGGGGCEPTARAGSYPCQPVSHLAGMEDKQQSTVLGFLVIEQDLLLLLLRTLNIYPPYSTIHIMNNNTSALVACTKIMAHTHKARSVSRLSVSASVTIRFPEGGE